MVRRSAPILPGLVVCLLFAVHPSGASPALRLDESRIRVSLEEAQTRVWLEVESGEARPFRARVTLSLLDPRDEVRAEGSSDASLRPGKNSLTIPIKLPYSRMPEAERKQFPWYRLRYRVAPEGGASVEAAAAVEGIVSLSEVTPDLFELRVVTSRRTRAGSQLRTRVRTFNPVTGRAVKGVAVAGELKFDDGSDPVVSKASGVTGGDGFASLDFVVPREVADDGDADLKINARRGAFADEAETEVSVEQKPRIILTTDKSLYQPGQTLHARALVFDPSDRAIAGEEVTLKLEDSRGETVFSEETTTSRYGIATADWPIPESSKLGEYTLSFEMDDSRYDTDEVASRGVRISRYDLPTVNVHDALASLVNAGNGASGGAAEIFVNGRRAGALDLPPATQVTGPLAFDLTPFVGAGDNRVEVRRAAGSALTQAQAVTTYYLPWAKALTNDGPNAPDATARGGQTPPGSDGASSLRLSVSYDRTSAEINQDVTCNVVAQRVGHSGYGMMLAEVGLPPGAEVDRESLDRTVKESGWSINSYDLLPDRVVLYLWPSGGGTKFGFKFRPRYGLDALTAPSTLYDYYNPEAHAVVAPTRFVVR